MVAREWFGGKFRGSVEMDITGDDIQHSLNSVQSPLKTYNTSAPTMGVSEHTLEVDEGDGELKGDYEQARDRRVAALKEFLRQVQTAATAL